MGKPPIRAELFRFVVGKMDFSGHFLFFFIFFVFFLCLLQNLVKFLDIQLLNITKVFIEIIKGVYMGRCGK